MKEKLISKATNLVEGNVNKIKNTSLFKEYIKGKLSISIGIELRTNAYTDIYRWICAYLKKNNPKFKRIEHIQLPPNSNIRIAYDEDKTRFVKKLQILSKYPILYRISKCGWALVLFRNNDREGYITVYFLGKDAYKNRHECIQYIYKCEYKTRLKLNKIACRDITVMGSYTIKSISKKRYCDIIWNKLDELTKYIERWGEMRAEYSSKNIPYKLSILLYGKPGTGKTSICNYIAGLTKRSLAIISPNTKIQDIKDFIDDNSLLCSKSILLFEDIDIFFDEASGYNISVEENSDTNSSKLHYLLQLFSGVNTPDNVIIICTTNYPEKLDSRLTRPGRFDLVYEIPEFNRDEAIKMCKIYDAPPDILLADKGNDDINPAELQSECIRYSIQERIKFMKESLS